MTLRTLELKGSLIRPDERSLKRHIWSFTTGSGDLHIGNHTIPSSTRVNVSPLQGDDLKVTVTWADSEGVFREKTSSRGEIESYSLVELIRILNSKGIKVEI